MKRKKAEERSHRFVIKGRKVMEHHLIHKGEKKEKRRENIDKDNYDYNMLFYDNDNI